MKVGSDYYVPLWAFRHTIKPYERNRKNAFYRRTLTDIVKLGIGKHAEVIKTSVENLEAELQKDGIVWMDFSSPYEKSSYKLNQKFPGPYSEIALEEDYTSDINLWCDLTF